MEAYSTWGCKELAMTEQAQREKERALHHPWIEHKTRNTNPWGWEHTVTFSQQHH